MKLRYMSYSLIIVFLLVSMGAFLYNRGLASYKMLSMLGKPIAINTQYTMNDRYDQVSKTIAQYSDVPLYFLSSSTNPADVSTSWQKIQTYYLAYPEVPQEINHKTDSKIISSLRNRSEGAVVITPFQQKEFASSAAELHPHAEYYIYIFMKK